jgi:hypothetical protein
MRAVGILCRSYKAMHIHEPFLAAQAERLNRSEGGDLTPLESFFAVWGAAGPKDLSSIPADVARHPAAVGHFCKFFERAAITIWKAVLLHKRVLFYTPAPIGSVLDRVHSACKTATVTATAIQRLTQPNPLFFVNVFDIAEMERLDSYVAVTTESIFREKPTLCDVYVDNRTVVIHDPGLRKILEPTVGDEEHFGIISTIDKTFMGTDSTSDYDIMRYFIDLNDELFERLSMAAAQGRTLRAADLDEFGLTPQDLPFLRELVHVYRLKIELVGGLC